MYTEASNGGAAACADQGDGQDAPETFCITLPTADELDAMLAPMAKYLDGTVRFSDRVDRARRPLGNGEMSPEEFTEEETDRFLEQAMREPEAGRKKINMK